MSVSFKEYTIREYTNGTKKWFLNGNYHREDGPAIEYSDGSKEWYLNGKWHREDGPAIEYADGYKHWFINGKRLTEEQHRQQTQSCTGKVVEVDGKKYVLTEV
jgi:hypothetical protein